MSYGTCKRITVLITNIFIFAFGLVSIVLNARYDINANYYYPFSVVLVTMIVGVIGAFLNVRVLLIIEAIMCGMFAAIVIAIIVWIWVAYGGCIHDNEDDDTDECYLNVIIWMTTAFTVCLLLLILSGVYSLKLGREIKSLRNGIIVVQNSAKLLE